MTEWPYIESVPLFSFIQEMNNILFHLDNMHYYNKCEDLDQQVKNQLVENEKNYYETLERNLNCGLIWC
jgi:hypothetical protein